LPVVKLIRVRIASLRIGGLKPGDYRALSDEEVAALKLGEKPKPIAQKQTNRPASHKRPMGPKTGKPARSKRVFKPNKPSRVIPNVVHGVLDKVQSGLALQNICAIIQFPPNPSRG
jgi:hypothetical protein